MTLPCPILLIFSLLALALSCLVKSSSSIVNPVIQLKTDPTAFNYCYIAAFSRYYYINDIVFEQGIWTCYCNVDVLASYKSTIAGTAAYCLRAYASYDNTLTDEAWPVSTSYDYQISTSPAQYSWTGFDNGYYVIGVKGTNNLSINGVIYYMLTAAQFTIFITQFYANTGNSTYFGNLARGVVDSIYNISDFIVSCRWYPIQLNTTSAKPVYIGSYQVPDGSGGYLNAPVCVEYPATVLPYGFQVPKHPEASWRGPYMNAAPFTRYEIKTPWGVTIPLDSYMMRDKTIVRMNLVVDFTTGQAALRIIDGATPYNESNVISYDRYTTYINFGVDIPLGGININVGGLLGNTAAALFNFATGNTLASLGNVGNALLNASPDPQPTPSAGGYVPIEGTQPFLASYFYTPAPTDYINHGRPYCVNTTPAAIGSGYMQFESFAVAITGTAEEASSINSYMVSGIYYE